MRDNVADKLARTAVRSGIVGSFPASFLLALGALLALPRSAEAQRTTRQPLTVEVPLPAGAPTTPGMPADMPAAGTGRVPVVKVVPRATRTEDEEGKSGDYEIYGRTDPRVPRFAVIGAPRTNRHLVRSGDTLWDICETYFQDPWRWPRVWAMNPNITNPHWIFPGDRIRLRWKERAGRRRAPATKVAEFGVEPRHAYKATPDVSLRQNGFIAERRLRYAGVIKGAPYEKILLATYDVIYIAVNRVNPLVAGRRYTIFKPRERVKHPHGDKFLGRLVEIVAEVEIQKVTWKKNRKGVLTGEGIARGIIVGAINPVERGYRVAELRRRYKSVMPVDNRTVPSFNTTVVTVLRPSDVIGTSQIVFLDAGRDRKLRTGHLFFVTRKGDAYRRTMEHRGRPRKTERYWPSERVAVLVLVEVHPHHSVAVVQYAVREIRVGDTARLQYSDK